MKKAIISILMMLVMAQAVFAADACGNVYSPFDYDEGVVAGPTFSSDDSSASTRVTVASYSPSSTTDVNFASSTDYSCTDTDVYSDDFDIEWTDTDSGTDFGKVVKTTDGKIVAAGTQSDDAGILRVVFLNSDGTVLATYAANFGVEIEYDITAADYSGAGVNIGVVTVTDGYLHSYYLTSAGQQWTRAYDLNVFINGFLRVDSNNDNLELALGDGSIVYAFLFDISDGSLDKSVTLSAAPDTLLFVNLYLDASGNSYLALQYDIVSDEFILTKVTSGGAESYERKLSSDVYQGSDFYQNIIECGSYLCLVGNFVNFNRVFAVNPSTGTVYKEMRYATTLITHDLAVSGDNLYVGGIDTNTDNFASSVDYASETVNWNNYYEDVSGLLRFDEIAVGDNTVGVISVESEVFGLTLLSKSTGAEIHTVEVEIEGEGYNNYYSSIEHSTGDYYYFTSHDELPLSGYTGLYGITAPIEGPVPEFSLTTLLLATLLAGGLVLFVVRRRK